MFSVFLTTVNFITSEKPSIKLLTMLEVISNSYDQNIKNTVQLDLSLLIAHKLKRSNI